MFRITNPGIFPLFDHRTLENGLTLRVFGLDLRLPDTFDIDGRD